MVKKVVHTVEMDSRITRSFARWRTIAVLVLVLGFLPACALPVAVKFSTNSKLPSDKMPSLQTSSPQRSKNTTVDYNQAIENLRYPATWCQGAELLAKIGDRRALMPLMQAYEARAEASKLCLLDAMEALDPKLGAYELYDSGGAEERRIALHLMELFPSEEYLPRLERAVFDTNSDTNSNLRDWARRALATQLQTPGWEALMIRLLDAEDEETRKQAIESLSRRRTDTARQALRDRLAREPNEMLRNKLQEALIGTSQ